MPLDPKIAELVDAGRVEDVDSSPFKDIFAEIEKAKRFDSNEK
jgi:hypothetical protein